MLKVKNNIGLSDNISQHDLINRFGVFKLISDRFVIFVSYEGFELISPAAPNIKDLLKNGTH